MFVKNLNAAQQSALLALANHICEQIPAELQVYNNQSFSVIDAVFGSKNGKEKLTKLDILKCQMEKDVQPSVVDITQLNKVFDTHRARLSVIGALIWLNGYGYEKLDSKPDSKSVTRSNSAGSLIAISVAANTISVATNKKTSPRSKYPKYKDWYVLSIEAAKSIQTYSQLLNLNLKTDIEPLYKWYELQQQADQAACNIFPIPDPFEKIEVKG